MMGISLNSLFSLRWIAVILFVAAIGVAMPVSAAADKDNRNPSAKVPSSKRAVASAQCAEDWQGYAYRAQAWEWYVKNMVDIGEWDDEKRRL